MTSKKTVIFKGLHIIRILASIAAVLFTLFNAIAPWYLSKDARYAVANLEYVCEKADEKAGIDFSINTKGWHRIKHPLPIALLELVDVSNAWSTGYANDYMRSNGAVSADLNPYEVLSSLETSTVNKQYAEVYEFVQYNAALTNPDSLDQIKDIAKSYDLTIASMSEKIVADMSKQIEFFRINVFIAAMTFIGVLALDITIRILKSIARKIRKSDDDYNEEDEE